ALPSPKMQLVTQRLVPLSAASLESWVSKSPALDTLFAQNWLAAIDRDAACERFEQMVQDESAGSFNKLVALRLLGRYQASNAADVAFKFFQDAKQDKELRVDCATYLGAVGHQAAVPALVAALSKEEPTALEMATLIALARLAPQQARAELLAC